MATNTLTDTKIRGLKPGASIVKAFDGEGLFVAVLPSGVKSWRMAYRFDGKQRTITFGPYPAVSLAEARKRRDEAKSALRDGQDPMAPRKVVRSAQPTFKEAAEAFLAIQDVSDSYRANVTRGLELHAFPMIGDIPIDAIDRLKMLEVLDSMIARGHIPYAKKVRIWAGLVFKWHERRGNIPVNPCKQIDPKEDFPRHKVKNFPALQVNEVPEFWQRLSLEDDLQSVIACKLLAYTWVRTNELRFATWSEFDKDTWRIPAKRMKMDNDHIVPLPRQAQELLAVLKKRAGKSAYILPAEHRPDRTISENTVLALIARIGYKGRMTGHGWRSIASTWANERGYNRDAIERQLAHVPDDPVRAAYMRAEFLEDRRHMMQDYADWLDGLVR